MRKAKLVGFVLAPLLVLALLFSLVALAIPTASAASPSWSTPVNISNNPDISGRSDIAIDNDDNLHVVWDNTTPGNIEILYATKPSVGAWSTPVSISPPLTDSESSAIAVDNSGNLHVVWEDYAAGNWEIYYSTSSDGGATWSTPVNISHTILAESSNSDIAVDNSGNICVVWQDYAMGNWEIYYSTSSDGGATWSTPVNISKNARVSAQPAIAMDNSGNLHVVWQDNSPTHWEIYYATSTDGGATWSTPVIITGDDYISEYPDIAIDSSSNLHVVWQDGIPNSEIYYAISPDGGTSWSHLVNISRNPSSKSELPDITIDNDDNLHVVWDDDATSDWEIYYATSSDGVWWSTPDNISHSTEYSGGAAIAIDNSDNPHVVWQEYVDGWNWEIYYASPVGGGGGGGLSGGAIAGIVVGSCAVAAGLITYFVIRRRRKRRAAG